MKNTTLIFLLIISFWTLIPSSIIAQTEKSQPIWRLWLNSQYASENNVNEFSMRSIRLIAKGNTTEKLSYHVMGEMIGTDGKPLLMQAWAAYKVNSFFVLRAGQFKYPFGMDAYGPWTTWKFANMAYVTGGIVKKMGREGALLRDIGIEASGTVPLSGVVSGVYKVMLMNGSGANIAETNDSKDVVGFWGLQLPRNILFGASLYRGKSGNATALDESAFGFVAQILQKNYTLQAEYISAEYQQTDGINAVNPAGYYIYGTYMLIPNVELGARFEAFNADMNGENTERSRFTLSTAYYFNTLNRILLNYEMRRDDMNSDIGNLLTLQFQAAL